MELTISLLFVLAAAIAAVEALNIWVCLIAFAAAGIGISVTLLLAGAQSAAILFLISETIVLALLARSSGGDMTVRGPSAREIAGTFVSVLFIAAAAYAIFLSLSELPASGPVAGTPGERGLDEITVAAALLAASIGSLVVLRSGAKKEEHK